MNFPTEEEIDVIVSEITDPGHIDPSSSGHADNCAFCSTMKELDSRSNFGNENAKPCAIDSFIMRCCQADPGVIMALNIFGPAVARGILEMGRMCFIIGIKLSDSKHGAEELKKMFGEI